MSEGGFIVDLTVVYIMIIKSLVVLSDSDYISKMMFIVCCKYIVFTSLLNLPEI